MSVSARPSGKVIDVQGIQWYAAETDAAQLLCYQAARELDQGGDYQSSSSAAKHLTSALARMAVPVCGAGERWRPSRSVATSAMPKPAK